MIPDFFVEILSGATEMISALATVLTESLTLIYDAGAVQPVGQLILAVGGIALAYAGFNFFTGLLKTIGSRVSRGKK
jgi:hypothetical protein